MGWYCHALLLGCSLYSLIYEAESLGQIAVTIEVGRLTIRARKESQYILQFDLWVIGE